ncbi:MAG: DMT family transporter [Anaerolineae bacterium]|jgi:drug/metabolite transporter (DMT)-like permease|nr:DMT family transporter [Anaerolineae bacterium]MBT3712474.1 DMT family transporter [Anaerolineae bacterium]MBT4309767.1 DMT family transporter [Anaerolineae bacterium]MBT4457988.1 DMT family transporter [Anaerolineae bacterium]MBT4841336.1 DMT family transporter [Anaerolineae bacterium]
MKNTTLGIISGLSAAAIWGAMYVVSKAVMAVIPPFSLLTSRLILGIATLFIIAFLQKKLTIRKKQFWSIVWVGFIGYGISLGFQFVGTNLSTAANGSLVTSATPAFVLIFAAIILGEKITRRRFIALLIASLGVLAVIDPRSAELASSLFWGNMSLVSAALTWALYSVLIRKVTRGVDVLTVSLIAFVGGLPTSIAFSVWEISTLGIGEITLGVIAGILFLGIIATALAMYLWNTAFALLDASLASLTFFAQPVVGTVLGAIFLGEIITPLFLFGGLLIGIGLVVASKE